MHLRHLSFLCIFAAVAGSTVHAQAWPQPQPALDPTAHTGTLGSLLEQRFSDLLTNCVTDKVLHKMKVGPGGKYTTIPKSLQSLPPAQTVVFSDQSIARAFTYIYTASEAKNKTLEGGTLGRYVELDALKDQASMQVKGFNIGLYQETCGSTLESALSAKAGISLPSEGFSSALDAQFNSGSSTTLTLGYATFQSPLTTMLQAHDQQNLFANLLFWLWYGNNPTHINDAGLSYISQFKGVSIIKSVSSQSDVKASANGSANVSFPVGSVEASIASQASQSTAGATTSFTTAIYNDATWQYDSAPNVASIIAAVANASPHLSAAKYDTTLHQGTSSTHSIDIDGIPAQMCTNIASNWQPRKTNDGASGALTITSVGFPTGADPTKNTCEFTVSFLPDDSLFPSTNGRIAPIKYQLTYSLTTANPPQAIAFGPVAIAVNTSDAPSFGADQANDPGFKGSTVKQPPSPDQQTATWTEKVDYDDGGDSITTASAPLNTAQITCASGTFPVAIAFSIEAPGKQAIDIAVSKLFPQGGRDLTAWDPCTLTGTLNLKTASGRWCPEIFQPFRSTSLGRQRYLRRNLSA
jgi:hypothetical protein